MENLLEELAVKLFESEAVKFGTFIMKTGLQTPVYFDLRAVISRPQLMKSISSLLWTLVEQGKPISQVCGVPYTALPIATLISVEENIPMLIRRKESKPYGTKKLIEGQFKLEENCMIIEDVVTSGSSILETAKDLINEGLTVEEAIVILDRQQGGRENLKAKGIEMKSLYTLTSLMQHLLNAGKVTSDTFEEVKTYVEQNQVELNSKE
ncbi:uridine 5'-monophosphate synthase-like [Neodiprion pinetum]|uniref:Uridine 5'-monophosphate synthase n=1 Tax=Neodiprion lecontei TaxID=441921 RepID=A0A6J0BK99_NEOLC|nr:uridine 5'-monophosphate synthase [Neodiprion lecontei]XP_046489767.1 uridine 5'-monophosphate synthase-like [Neodiprion pinetum]